MNWRERGRAALREPLVHFLIGGALVFAFFAWRGDAVDPASRRIDVTATMVGQLAAQFEQTMQREPTRAELDGLIRDHIREEIYYREALRLGLDADDSVIRRRLRSKMEYLARASIEGEQPSEATLQAWLKKNASRYAKGGLVSFDQIYLGNRNADNVRAELAKGMDWHRIGQPLSVPSSLENADPAEIARDFGHEFADSVVAEKPGSWVGPVQSGFGLHLVRIRAVTPVAAPKLSEVRQQVENDWRAETAAQREAKAYQTLLDGYDIRIEKP